MKDSVRHHRPQCEDPFCPNDAASLGLGLVMRAGVRAARLNLNPQIKGKPKGVARANHVMSPDYMHDEKFMGIFRAPLCMGLYVPI